MSFQYHVTKMSSVSPRLKYCMEKYQGLQEKTCNTLYDLRMGAIEKGGKCETYSMDYTKCKGHFGHIALAMSVVNPICLKKLKWIVRHICKKCTKIVITKPIKKYKLAASSFQCLASRTSNDMFDVENTEDLEEVSKALTKMCQDNIDVLNIKGCCPKSCIIHYFPIIPTYKRPF